MARNLTWVFELMDRFSGPGSNIIKTIKGIQSAMNTADKVSSSAAKTAAKKAGGVAGSGAVNTAKGAYTATMRELRVKAASARADIASHRLSTVLERTSDQRAAKAARAIKKDEQAIKQAQRELLKKMRLEYRLQRIQETTSRQQTIAAQRAVAHSMRLARVHGKNADILEARSKKMFAAYNAGFAGTVRQVFSGSSRMDQAMRSMANNISQSGSSGWRSWSRSAFYAMSNVNLAWDAMKSAMSGPMAIGMEAIEATSFRDMSLAVMETYLPDGQDAADVYEKVVGFAEQLRVPTKEVELTFARMLSSGFRLSEVPIAFQGISDVIRGAGLDAQETIGFLSRALGQIKGRAALNAQDFKQITEQITVAGVGEQDVQAAVARKVGMPLKDLMARLDNGEQIESSLAVYGIFDAIRTRLARKTGKLGTVTQRMADSPMNTLKFIASKPFDLFREMGRTEGMQSFAAAMENVLYLTASTTTEGKALKKTIEDMTSGGFQAIFGNFKGEEGRERMLGFFNRLLNIVQSVSAIFAPVFKVAATAVGVLSPLVAGVLETLAGAMPILGALMQGFIMAFTPLTIIFGFLFEKVGKVLQWFGQYESAIWIFKALGVFLGIIAMALTTVAITMGIITVISAALASPWLLIAAGIMAVVAAITWLIEKYKALGEAGISGLIAGWLSGKGRVEAAGGEVVRSLETGVAVAQDSHSPSNLFRTYGGYAAEGYALGVEGGSERVKNSFGSFEDAPQGPSGKSNKAAKSNGAAVFVTVSNVFHAGTEDKDIQDKLNAWADVEFVPRLRAALNAELAGG